MVCTYISLLARAYVSLALTGRTPRSQCHWELSHTLDMALQALGSTATAVATSAKATGAGRSAGGVVRPVTCSLVQCPLPVTVL